MNAEAEAIAPAPRMSLTEIVAAFRDLLLVVDEQDGEVTDELFAALEAVEADLAKKVDGCLWVAVEAEGRADVLAARAKALGERAGVLANTGKRLRAYVHESLKAAGVPKLETPNFVASVNKNPASVDIEEVDAFITEHKADAEIVETKTTYTPIKKAIAERLKAGVAVKGAKLITDRTNLKVK
jgi:hypothetical protein